MLLCNAKAKALTGRTEDVQLPRTMNRGGVGVACGQPVCEQSEDAQYLSDCTISPLPIRPLIQKHSNSHRGAEEKETDRQRERAQSRQAGRLVGLMSCFALLSFSS